MLRVLIAFNTLDATRHLVACVCIVLTRHAALKVSRSQGCGNAMRHLSGAKKKATKIQFAPVIVAVRDGLYCRVNFTVRLAVHSLLSGRTSVSTTQ